MRKHSLAAIQREMKDLKKTAMQEMFCIAFLDTTDDPNTFELHKSVYASKGKVTKIRSHLQRLSTPELRELISDDTTQERFDEIMETLKIFPDGCDPDKSVLFVYDYGEFDNENDEL